MSLRTVFGVILAMVAAGCVIALALSNNRPPQGDSAKRMAVAYAVGGKGDQSYNDAVVGGVELLRKDGYDVQEHEPPAMDQYREALEVLAQKKPRVIFCVGYMYDDAVRAVAPKHADTAFVVLDGGAEGKNVWSIKFRSDQGSELAGAVAAALSKAKKAAFVGGMNIPAINEFKIGFEAGAKATDPSVSVTAYYVASTPIGFSDPVKGKEVALSAIAAGADVLFHAAGTSGNGIIGACKDKGVLAIGVDVDQRHFAPATVVTSVVKRFDVAMSHFIVQYENNALPGGSIITLGYTAKAVDVTPIDRPEWAAARAAVDQRRRDLLSRE